MKDISGSPTAMHLGDRTIFISPPTIADSITVRKYITKIAERNSSPLADLLPELSKLPPHLAEAAIKQATSMKVNKEVSEAAMMEAMLSKDAICFFVYVLAKAHTPDITLEWVEEQVNEDNMGSVLETLAEVSGTESLGLKK